MNGQDLGVKFKEIFGHGEFQSFFSPGRINLIGEHTDYNGGYVFPCAITLGTYGLAKKREGTLVRLYSLNFPSKGIIEFDLDNLEFDNKHAWANYPKGMIRGLKEEGFPIDSGLDILVYGNLPNGAGLSSSASIEMLTGVILQELYQFHIDRIDLVKLGMKVENHFIKVKSGIMDQFAVGMGKKDCAILLDCKNLEYKYRQVHLESHKIIIMNTNKRRELTDSKYNERQSECQIALNALQQGIKVNSLCDLTVDEFNQHKSAIKNDVIRKRAKHVVTENHRTLKAFELLQSGDLQGFGELMNESHRSLRDDYEVTGIELDTLVEASWTKIGVVGARMTGAGFGGCAIAIVENSHLDSFIQNVGKAYLEKVGYKATFYTASIGGAANLVCGEAELCQSII